MNLSDELSGFGQKALVLQGGGALGAYQAGVFQALDEAGICPDWVIGTSIGAINAAIIAGSPRGERLLRLRDFWHRVENRQHAGLPGGWGAMLRNFQAISGGVPGFFTPQAAAFWNPAAMLGAEAAGYYSTAPLKDTLNGLIDWDMLNTGGIRLTVGAARVGTADMVYFDSRDMTLDVRHVMASGALPPAFPAVRIGEDLYWDGGILSNTPVEAVFDDMPRRDGIVFSVHLWNPHGSEPRSIWQVLNRQKDLQYASRSDAQVRRQRELHRLRHIIAQLTERLPGEVRQTPEVARMAAYGCLTRMHVIRLLAPTLPGEDHAKDIDFSADGIACRWKAGYEDTLRTLEQAPWRQPHDDMEGVVLHAAMAGELMADPAMVA